MKRLGSLILMKICLVSLLIVAPAGAAISPTNQMTGWTDGSNVHLEVYDPKIDGYWIYMYSIGSLITNFNISNGIARWCEADSIGGGYYVDHIAHVLFDPDRGWIYGASDWIGTIDKSSLQESNGVVSVWGLTDPYGEWKDVYFSTYDPVKGYWVSVSKVTAAYPFLVNQDGIIAFFYDDPTSPGDPASPQVRCYIYDNAPGRGWRKGIFSPAPFFSVEQASVRIDYGGTTTTYGYKPVDGIWQEGQTLCKAYFWANPNRGSPPCGSGSGIFSWQHWPNNGTSGMAPQFIVGAAAAITIRTGEYIPDQFVVGFPGGFFDETTKTIYVRQGRETRPCLCFYWTKSHKRKAATGLHILMGLAHPAHPHRGKNK